MKISNLKLKIVRYLFYPRFHLNRFQFNLVALFFISLGLVGGSYFTLSKILPVIFAESYLSITKDSDSEFSQGIFDSTVVVGTGSSAVVRLDVGGGPDGTRYKREVVINNTGGNNLYNYQVSFTLDTASLISNGKMRSDCGDIRILDNDNSTALDFWLEGPCNNSSSRIWVKVPTLPASSQKNIYLYYGNLTASSVSDGEKTFDFFDDFVGNSLNTNKWVAYSSDYFVSGGYIRINVGGIELVSPLSFNLQDGYLAETRFRYESTESQYGGTIPSIGSSSYTAFGNSNSDAAVLYLRNAGGTTTVYYWIANGSSGSYNVADTVGTSWSPSTGSWYIGGISVLGGRVDLWRDRIIGNTISNITWYKNMRYVKLGSLQRNSTYNIHDISYDWIIVRKYSSPEPSVNVGSESGAIYSSGYWESSSDSNVIDLVWNGGWGDGSSNSTAFSATVANLASTNYITFYMRAASSLSALSSSSWIELGVANSGTNFVKTKSELDALGLPTGTARYIQVKASFTQTSGVSPSLDGFTIYFLGDNANPEANANNVVMYRSFGGSPNPSNGWTNNSSPYFSWSSGSDSQSGLKGYCLYLGTDPNGNPATSKGLLGTSPVSTNGTTCQFIVSGTSIDFATSSYKGSTWLSTSNDPYYLNIKAVDNAGNVFTGSSAQFQFRFDNIPPTNTSYISCASGSFSNVADMNFSWPTSGSVASSDSNAGLLGWQYQINSTSGTWLGTTSESTLGVGNYIPTNESSRTLTQAQDGLSIVSGNNIVYFRTVDAAGNTSSDGTIRTCNLSYGGAAPAFGATDTVTVTPSTSTSNSYALSWPAATPANGQTVTHYYYMVNTAPPSTLATLQGNAATYIDNGTSLTVAATALPGVNKGSNTVYVVAIDDASTPNYSPSNYITGTFTLNSTDPDNVGNLVASDSSIKSQSQWNVTLTWTEPTYQGAGNLTYLIYRSTDGTTFSQVGSTSGLSYVDNTPSSRLYYYKVYTKDGANATSSGTNAVSITPTGKWTSAPSLESGPTVSGITTKKATITWSTSRTCDSKVQYGTNSGSYNTVEPSNSSQVTSHSIQLTGLNPGTTYYYKAKWTDEDGNTGTSEEKSFTTASAPTVKDVSAKNIGLTSAIIQFTSKDASKVKIYYGTSTSFGGIKEISTSTSETTYTAELSSLNDGTKYYYKINSFDTEDSEYEGTILDFTTLPRPKISNVRIQQVANTAQPTILVTWTTNTDVSSIMTYYPAGSPSDARDEVNVALTKGEHRMIVRGLMPQTDYILVVKGRDKIGNEAVSDSQRFTTATDTRPPQISELHVEGAAIPPTTTTAQESTAQLIVSWNTDEPGTSQVEFGEGTGTTYSSKTQEDSNLTFNHLVIISGLTPSKVYHLRAISKDKAGNIGNSIDTVTITPKATENALNLVITNLQEAFGFIGNLKK